MLASGLRSNVWRRRFPVFVVDRGERVMSKPDLTYSDAGLFVTFLPQTPAGEEAWRVMAGVLGDGAKCFAQHLPGVLAQLRAAGYRVAKHKPAKATGPDDDALLAELLA